MNEKSELYWKKSSQSFDTVAEDYDEFRPSYPEELVDGIIELTHLPPEGKILEVGAGTGKATLLFAERNYAMLCLEPGANLAAVAARNCKAYSEVKFEISRFENWQETPNGFDLVISAQAFHWVPKDVGYAKAAKALKTTGSLALFWNMYPGIKLPLKTELDKIYHDLVPEIENPLTKMEETISTRIADIETSGFFGPVTLRRFPWSMCYTSKQYQGLLNTYSDHLLLPEEKRMRLYKAVGDMIDEHGGFLERPYVAVLFVARKLS
jgi:SAM-dependent methyltransferase